MNIRHFVLAIIMFAAGCVVTAALSSRSLHIAAKSPEPTFAAQTTPQRWEYRVVTNSGSFGGINISQVNTELTRLGEQGFEEVVWSGQNGSKGAFRLTLLLRRPKQ